LWWAECTPTGVKNSEFMETETVIVSIVALALFAYLFIAMVYPEKF
jgi:K+-transporting ATPase KdpF subunit